MLRNELATLRMTEEEDEALLVRWRNSPRIRHGFFNRFPRPVGAHPEGLLRQAVFDEGRYRDVLPMSLLSSKYMQAL